MIDRFKRLFQRDQAPTAQGPGAMRDGAVGVLMVCTGNICRSPTAEAVLRHKLQQAGLANRVWVDSAGTHGFHTQEPPDPRAVAVAAQRGYDLSSLRARPVQADDFHRHHWLLAMDEANLAWLRRKAPEGHGGRVALLLSQARRHAEREVPDPYYGSVAGFDRVLDLVEDACEGWVAQLQRPLGDVKLD